MNTTDEIAEALQTAWFNIPNIAITLESTWAPAKGNMTIEECLNRAADIWSESICNETGYNHQQKTDALSVHLSSLIKKK